MRRVLIVGATSAIAEATARLFAAEGDALVLVGRNGERLHAVADDLSARGAASADCFVMDAVDIGRHEEMIEAAIRAMGGLDSVLVAYGTLSDQAACERDVDLTLRELSLNALSVIALLTPLANRFERQGFGTIAVISSVAGDRGRQSNYVYGAAKAALDTFLEGLRQRLHKSGVRVVTIKPGFVDTPMTRHIEKKGLLWATPAQVARPIHRSMTGSADVLYVPFFWRFIMAVIRNMPRRVFKSIRL